jgi:hypothetical protein
LQLTLLAEAAAQIKRSAASEARVVETGPLATAPNAGEIRVRQRDQHALPMCYPRFNTHSDGSTRSRNWFSAEESSP